MTGEALGPLKAAAAIETSPTAFAFVMALGGFGRADVAVQRLGAES